MLRLTHIIRLIDQELLFVRKILSICTLLKAMGTNWAIVVILFHNNLILTLNGYAVKKLRIAFSVQLISGLETHNFSLSFQQKAHCCLAGVIVLLLE